MEILITLDVSLGPRIRAPFSSKERKADVTKNGAAVFAAKLANQASKDWSWKRDAPIAEFSGAESSER